MSGGAGPDPRLVASSAHVFVDDVEHPLLADDDRHHVLRVLRLRAGEAVSVSDGRGSWRPCVLGDHGELTPDGAPVHCAAPAYEISIAFVPPKGDRPELIVQKLTEIGADRIIPMSSQRSQVRWDGDRLAKQMGRFERIIREAAMQSRRVRLPVLEPFTTFDEVAARPGVAIGAPGGERLTIDERLILIGPEGGWSESEESRPLSRVGLGETILRAETAALVACALAVSVRAEFVANRP